MHDAYRTARQPAMNPDCVGDCGRRITDDDNYDKTGVHLEQEWFPTETPRGYGRVRCPICSGRS